MNAGLLEPEDYDVDHLREGEEQRATGSLMPGMFNMVEGHFGGYRLNEAYPNHRMNPHLANTIPGLTAAQVFARDIANNPLQTLDIERSFYEHTQHIPRLAPERVLLPGDPGYDSPDSDLSDIETESVLPLQPMTRARRASSGDGAGRQISEL